MNYRRSLYLLPLVVMRYISIVRFKGTETRLYEELTLTLGRPEMNKDLRFEVRRFRRIKILYITQS